MCGVRQVRPYDIFHDRVDFLRARTEHVTNDKFSESILFPDTSGERILLSVKDKGVLQTWPFLRHGLSFHVFLRPFLRHGLSFHVFLRLPRVLPRVLPSGSAGLIPQNTNDLL